MQAAGILVPFALALLFACSAAPAHDASPAAPATRVVDLRRLPDLDAIIPELADRQVVFVGEIHDRYSHHLNQLAVIRGLQRRHPDLVIALEFFQQPFQRHLDDYVAGKISEKEMLRRTEYFSRWQIDYRHYRPILRHAREAGLKLLALNVPAELTRKVGRQGLEGLDAEERAKLPEIRGAGEAYRERLKSVYEQHLEGGGSFEHFVEAQLLWDEAMAEHAAQFLRRYPGRPMVVLAGAGHIAFGAGIPARLKRRVEVDTAVVINDPQEALTADIADFVLLTEPVPLPPRGRLGIFMETASRGSWCVALPRTVRRANPGSRTAIASSRWTVRRSATPPTCGLPCWTATPDRPLKSGCNAAPRPPSRGLNTPLRFADPLRLTLQWYESGPVWFAQDGRASWRPILESSVCRQA